MYRTLITVDELEAMLADDTPEIILDCRYDISNANYADEVFADGHVPNAIRVDMDTQLSGPHVPGAGRHPWPLVEDWQQQLSTWGIGPDTQVFVYDQGPGMFAARAWFLLKSVGHEAVAVLDGGFKAWEDAGKPISGGKSHSSPIERHERMEFEQQRLVDADELLRRQRDGWTVVDSRSADRYRGENETIDRVGGHVPGALNRPFADNLTADGRFKSADQLAEELKQLLGSQSADQSIFYCGSGVTAAHNLLAMEIARLPGASLYTGSWSGWTEDEDRPVNTGDQP